MKARGRQKERKGRERINQESFLSLQAVFLTINYSIETYHISTINHSELIILFFFLLLEKF